MNRDNIPRLVTEKTEPLATEMLREVKANGRRWFIIALVELLIILAMAGLFLWYATLPVEEIEIDQDSDESSYNQVIGGDYNGSTSENFVQTPSSESSTVSAS